MSSFLLGFGRQRDSSRTLAARVSPSLLPSTRRASRPRSVAAMCGGGLGPQVVGCRAWSEVPGLRHTASIVRGYSESEEPPTLYYTHSFVLPLHIVLRPLQCEPPSLLPRPGRPTGVACSCSSL